MLVHEFDVIKTTAQGMTEPGLSDRVRRSASDCLRRNFDRAP